MMMIQAWQGRSKAARSAEIVEPSFLPGLRRDEARRIRKEVRAKYAPLMEAAADKAARRKLRAQMNEEIAALVANLEGSPDEEGPLNA
ncbi:MAG: hypothetical protein C4547_01485 [Phycisphaerales bacterium]|nr:MAG: hypothetical protein C4547_01485 [Phycisphaerales bacterium]